MDIDTDDEVLRAVLEESLRTAAEEQQRHAEGWSGADQPTSRADSGAPSAPAIHPAGEQATDNAVGGGNMSWEQQRLESLRHQRERWQQLHGQQQQQEASQHAGVNQAGYYHAAPAPANDRLPSASSAQQAGSSSGLYPPGLAIPQTAAAADVSEEQRRRQQEEEDHKLAMQLAAAFEEEDRAAEAMPGLEPGSDEYHDSRSMDGSEDWEQVARTASMQQQPEAVAGSSSSRLSSQAGAAAGSGMGGLVGAGLSALLAMAAHAAANSQQSDAHTSADGTAAASSSTAAQGNGSGSSATASAGSGNANAQQSSSHVNGGNQSPGFLSSAASALRNYLIGRNEASSSSSSATASTNTENTARQQGPMANEQPGPDDMVMLQQLMQAMMGGPGAAAAAGENSRDGQGSGGSTGFRVVRLPGGGFAASYSSSGGGIQQQQQQHSDHAGPGFPMFTDDDDPFGFMAGGAGNDFFSQLLLAGARSAHGNHRRQQHEGSGFIHFDPAAGAQGRFEPMEGEGLHPAQGLEALFGALMGQGMFGGEGGSLGGFRYEDLVGLDPVHVSTPEAVLSSLPRSTYVEGRKPGDSDTCVICQTAYAAGDELMHLPCLHAFHADCITPWLQGHSKKCPVCKTDVC